MSGETVARARGRWGEILPLLGVERRYLTGKHGPCPLCPGGGRDRFRWDNKNGDGTYFCAQCGAGNAITLLRKLHGWNCATTFSKIDEIIGRGDFPAAVRTRATPDDAARR